jgi:LasA protease
MPDDPSERGCAPPLTEIIMSTEMIRRKVCVLLLAGIAACAPEPPVRYAAPTATVEPPIVGPIQATPLPTRIPLAPGQIMEYAAQSGDTLEAVAAHFNTTVTEIRSANPDLPRVVTTLLPGRIYRIPAYFAPFSGTPFQILPDSEVVAGPSVSGFSVRDAVNTRPGWLQHYSEFAFQKSLSGWELVQQIARDYSVNPRLLLALLEYRSQALSREDPDGTSGRYPLGLTGETYPGVAMQLMWAAETINEGYYGWRTGSLRVIELADTRISRPDSWQNAGTVAVQYLLAKWFKQEEFDRAIGPDGFVQTYRGLFGDPFAHAVEIIPGDLQQPVLQLPFEPGMIWAYTGGPHPAWGNGLPWAAVDFAPPLISSGCIDTDVWATAMADGVIARSEPALVILDLDGDGDEHTGWTILYYHLAEAGRAVQGTSVQAGGRIGHPSCEGGHATDTHVHVARRLNGEWISAAGPLAFNLSNWIVGIGANPYDGTLSYFLDTVLHACDCVNAFNQISFFPVHTPMPQSPP